MKSLTISVTSEQEDAIRQLFDQRGWNLNTVNQNDGHNDDAASNTSECLFDDMDAGLAVNTNTNSVRSHDLDDDTTDDDISPRKHGDNSTNSMGKRHQQGPDLKTDPQQNNNTSCLVVNTNTNSVRSHDDDTTDDDISPRKHGDNSRNSMGKRHQQGPDLKTDPQQHTSCKSNNNSKSVTKNIVEDKKSAPDPDWDSDLEDFDKFNFDDFDKPAQSTSKPTDIKKSKDKKLETTDSYQDDIAACINDADEFEGDDFDADELEALEEAERSYLNVSEEQVDQIEPEVTVVETEDDDIENQPQDHQYLDTLKQYFGYSKFRPMQWKILHSIMIEKKDNCVIMATGYGKSLCYQFPSVMTGRTTVVISPLISLMQDQVLGLQAANIPSCYLGSAQENSGDVKRQLLQGHYRVLYITPEYATSGSDVLRKLDDNVGIDLIAIDEAHCVSQWGHDFRASFRNLGQLKSTFPKVCV